MKKLAGRLFLLTALFVMALAMYAFAGSVTKTVNFPNSYGGGWSGQFTTDQDGAVSISVFFNNSQATYINKGLTFVVQNVNTNQQYSYQVPAASVNNCSYTMSRTLPVGTYEMGVYYKGAYSFPLTFTVKYSGSASSTALVNKVTVAVGGTTEIEVPNTITSISGSSAVASYTLNKLSTPHTVKITGKIEGLDTLYLYGSDKTTRTVSISVQEIPGLLYKKLEMAPGQSITNKVVNKGTKPVWTTSNKNIATVKNGKITAVGAGTCKIQATTKFENKQYILICTVKVTKDIPNFWVKVTKAVSDSDTIRMKIKNVSATKMTIFSDEAKLYSAVNGKKLCNLKFRSGTSVTLNPGTTKVLKFRPMKSSFNVQDDPKLYNVRFLLKLDNTYYYGSAFNDEYLGMYRYKTSDDTEWKTSYVY